MFGFLAALLVTGGRRGGAHRPRRPQASDRAPAPSADLPNGAMVERFNSYLYRARGALPAPAHVELDAMSRDPAFAQADARAGRDARSGRPGRAAADVGPPARADRSLRTRSRRLPAGTGRGGQDGRPATGRGACRRPRCAWRRPPTGSRAPTWPRWKRKAGSSSHATASRRIGARACARTRDTSST